MRYRRHEAALDEDLAAPDGRPEMGGCAARVAEEGGALHGEV
jgi:hypothetical protein